MRNFTEVVTDNEQFYEKFEKAYGDMEKGKELLRERCQKFIDMIIRATNPVAVGDAIFLIYALETYAETIREQDPEAAKHTDELKYLFGHKGAAISGTVTMEREAK